MRPVSVFGEGVYVRFSLINLIIYITLSYANRLSNTKRQFTPGNNFFSISWKTQNTFVNVDFEHLHNSSLDAFGSKSRFISREGDAKYLYGEGRLCFRGRCPVTSIKPELSRCIHLLFAVKMHLDCATICIKRNR